MMDKLKLKRINQINRRCIRPAVWDRQVKSIEYNDDNKRLKSDKQ